jgi:hypothetical protein
MRKLSAHDGQTGKKMAYLAAKSDSKNRISSRYAVFVHLKNAPNKYLAHSGAK